MHIFIIRQFADFEVECSSCEEMQSMKMSL
jgi:hypothetical protein